MTYYEFLVLMDEQGYLKGLTRCCMPSQHLLYMEIYRHHLAHPKESQLHVSIRFNRSKKYVYNAYRCMNQLFMPG